MIPEAVPHEEGIAAPVPRRLRILGIADAGQVHTRKWANYLARQGHHVKLLSFVPLPDGVPDALDPSVAIEDWHLPSFHLKRPWITLAALFRLRRLLRRWRPDLVQVHFLGAGAWYAALAGSRPLAIWVMGGGDVLGSVWQPQSGQERILSPLALKRADLLLCWSPNLLAIVRPFVAPKTPCEVVVGGVDTEIFRPRTTDGLRNELGLAPDAFVILSARLMWPRHNVELMLRALPMVLREEPRARLLIVRYRAEQFPDYARFLESEVERLELGPYVRFLRGLPNQEMPAYFSLADCVVSIPDTDGTPMTVMEALACGTPALVHDLPDYDPELFREGETVLRVPFRSAEGLAQKILALSRDPGLCDRLAQEGRRLVDARLGYRAEMRRLEVLYDRLVSRGRA